MPGGGAPAHLAELVTRGAGRVSSFGRAARAQGAQLVRRAGVGVPERERSADAAARILELARTIEHDSDTLVGQVGGYRELLAGLGGWMEQSPAIIRRARRTGELVAMFDSQDAESSVPDVSERVSERTARAVEQLGGLTSTVGALVSAVAQLSFRASLMRLHTLVLGIYAAAVVDGTEDDVPRAMTELSHALAEDLADIGPVCNAIVTRSDELDELMRSVVSDLDRTRRPFGRWLRARQDGHAARRGGVEGDVLALLGEAERLSEAGFPEMSALATLAARCRGLDFSYNSDAMQGTMAAVADAIGDLV